MSLETWIFRQKTVCDSSHSALHIKLIKFWNRFQNVHISTNRKFHVETGIRYQILKNTKKKTFSYFDGVFINCQVCEVRQENLFDRPQFVALHTQVGHQTSQKLDSLNTEKSFFRNYKICFRKWISKKNEVLLSDKRFWGKN